jgi:hypothetical protein
MRNNLRKIFRHRRVKKASNLGYYGGKLGDIYRSSDVDGHYSP